MGWSLFRGRKSEKPAEIRIVQPRADHEKKARGEEWEKAGLDFEKFIITRFNREAHRLLDWRGDKYIEHYGGPESSKDPDVLFMCRGEKDKFAIECKYRSGWWNHSKYGPCIEWAREDQMKHYLGFQRRRGIVVYVAIGIGGEPSKPAELFIGRLEEIRFCRAGKKHLEKFRVPANVGWGGLEFA